MVYFNKFDREKFFYTLTDFTIHLIWNISFREMLYFLGASGFKYAFNSLSYCDRRHLQSRALIFAASGLSFNPHAQNKLKDLNFLLSKSPRLKHQDKLIILPGVINNTISKHRSNGYRQCAVEKLLSILVNLKPRVAAIVYCRREGLRDISAELRTTGILVIEVKRHLLSYKKRNDPAIITDVAKLHPSVGLHLHILSVILHRQHSLWSLIKNVRSKSKVKLSKKRRERARRKNLISRVTP